MCDPEHRLVPSPVKSVEIAASEGKRRLSFLYSKPSQKTRELVKCRHVQRCSMVKGSIRVQEGYAFNWVPFPCRYVLSCTGPRSNPVPGRRARACAPWLAKAPGSRCEE